MGDKERRKDKRKGPRNASIGEDSGPPPEDFEQTFIPADAGGEDEDFGGTFIESTPEDEEIARQATHQPPGSDSIDEDTAETAVLSRRKDWPVISDVDLEKEIGRGGMGVVYSGRQSYLDRQVAVKLLAASGQGPSFAARFQREAKILASLSHPHIVSCYQAGTLPDGKCFLVMEFIDGPNLLEWIKAEGALSVARALAVTRDVALALECAFEKTIIHRDVKPANVLLQRVDGSDPEFPFRSKLADLGLARDTSDDSTQMALTVQGAVMGSPPTMAPEQFDDPDSVDYRADIYALGCTLYHMLTGCLAFPQKTITAALSSKLSGDVPDPCALKDDLHPEVSTFVKALLARHAEQRPQSYEEVVRTCNELLGLVDRMPAPRAKKKGSGVLIGGIGALVLAGGAAGVYFGLGPGEEPQQEPGSPTNVAGMGGAEGSPGATGSTAPGVDPGPEDRATPGMPNGAGQEASTGPSGVPPTTAGDASSIESGTETELGAAGSDGGTGALEGQPGEVPAATGLESDAASAEDSSSTPVLDGTDGGGGAEGTGEAQDDEAALPRNGSGEPGGLEPSPTDPSLTTPLAVEPEGLAAAPPDVTYLPALQPGESLQLFDADMSYPLKRWELPPGEEESWGRTESIVSGRVNRRSDTGLRATHLVPEGEWSFTGDLHIPWIGSGIKLGHLARVSVEFDDGSAIGFDVFTEAGGAAGNLQRAQAVELLPSAGTRLAERSDPICDLGSLTHSQLGEQMDSDNPRDGFVRFSFSFDGETALVVMERIDGGPLRRKDASETPLGNPLRPVRVTLQVEGYRGVFRDLRFARDG